MNIVTTTKKASKKFLVYVSTVLLIPFVWGVLYYPSWRNKRLEAAVAEGNAARVEQFLRQGADPNMEVCTSDTTAAWVHEMPFDIPYKMQPRTCSGTSPILYVASYKENKDKSVVVEALLRYGAKVHSSVGHGSQKRTALDEAIESNDFVTVKVLFAHGATLARDSNGFPFDTALRKKNDPLFRLLFAESQKLDAISAQDAFRNALDAACKWNNFSEFRFLLQQQSANRKEYAVACNKALLSATQTAYSENEGFPGGTNPEMAALLLRKGANPNVKGWYGMTPLMNTLDCAGFQSIHQKADQSTSRLLLKSGASLFVKDDGGKMPIDRLELVKAFNNLAGGLEEVLGQRMSSGGGIGIASARPAAQPILGSRLPHP